MRAPPSIPIFILCDSLYYVNSLKCLKISKESAGGPASSEEEHPLCNILCFEGPLFEPAFFRDFVREEILLSIMGDLKSSKKVNVSYNPNTLETEEELALHERDL